MALYFFLILFSLTISSSLLVLDKSSPKRNFWVEVKSFSMSQSMSGVTGLYGGEDSS